MTRTPTTDEWGIDASWLDAFDEEHSVPQQTIERLREVIGRPPADLEDRAPIVARHVGGNVEHPAAGPRSSGARGCPAAVSGVLAGQGGAA